MTVSLLIIWEEFPSNKISIRTDLNFISESMLSIDRTCVYYMFLWPNHIEIGLSFIFMFQYDIALKCKDFQHKFMSCVLFAIGSQIKHSCRPSGQILLCRLQFTMIISCWRNILFVKACGTKNSFRRNNRKESRTARLLEILSLRWQRIPWHALFS